MVKSGIQLGTYGTYNNYHRNVNSPHWYLNSEIITWKVNESMVILDTGYMSLTG
jgi:hypothetical protein